MQTTQCFLCNLRYGIEINTGVSDACTVHPKLLETQNHRSCIDATSHISYMWTSSIQDAQEIHYVMMHIAYCIVQDGESCRANIVLNAVYVLYHVRHTVPYHPEYRICCSSYNDVSSVDWMSYLL